ncbi:hypothetical protein D3C80_1750810 [compost metagenome]
MRVADQAAVGLPGKGELGDAGDGQRVGDAGDQAQQDKGAEGWAEVGKHLCFSCCSCGEGFPSPLPSPGGRGGCAELPAGTLPFPAPYGPLSPWERVRVREPSNTVVGYRFAPPNLRRWFR